jgi:predicted RNA-binding Zn ribbon-like protein
MPGIRDGFKFFAGHVALDLPCTLAGRLKPQPRELLERPADLARWLTAAQLTRAPPDAGMADLILARELRETLYALAMHRIEGSAFPAGLRRSINSIAAKPAAVPELDRHGRMSLSGNTRALLAGIARDAIRLLGHDLELRIRQCEGETCALLFVDTSRAGDRRWCSMTGCGNRAKVAEFRRRRGGS